MAKKPQQKSTAKTSKRRNRTIALGEAINGTLDSVLKKRGFASESIFTHWQSIAPAPYDTCAFPDTLKWKRGSAGAEGATLFLRCSQAHALALSHEGDKIAQAVNRYYGYFLVGSVKMSSAPFSPRSAKKKDTPFTPSPHSIKMVDGAIHGVADEGLKYALRELGLKIMNKDTK